MTELESLKCLLEWVESLDENKHLGYLSESGRQGLRNIVDAILEEVDERYMERPCDKNGEPTHIGQRIEHRGHEGEVWLLGIHEVMCSDRVCYPCGEYRHVKPRTVEDVLREFVGEYEDSNGPEYDEECIARFAAELQMKGGE